MNSSKARRREPQRRKPSGEDHETLDVRTVGLLDRGDCGDHLVDDLGGRRGSGVDGRLPRRHVPNHRRRRRPGDRLRVRAVRGPRLGADLCPRGRRQFRGAMRVLAGRAPVAAVARPSNLALYGGRRGHPDAARSGLRRRAAGGRTDRRAGLRRAAGPNAHVGRLCGRLVVDRLEGPCVRLSRHGLVLHAHAGRRPQRFGHLRRGRPENRRAAEGPHAGRPQGHRHLRADPLPGLRFPQIPDPKFQIPNPKSPNVPAGVARRRSRTCCLTAIGSSFAINSRYRSSRSGRRCPPHRRSTWDRPIRGSTV